MRGLYRLAMTPRRSPRLRASLLVVGLLLLFVAVAAGVALTARTTSPELALDPNIPNERALIALGLSGTPGLGQPTHPIAVDRVLVDGAATYVQFHLTGDWGGPGEPHAPQGNPADVTLSDDQGTVIDAGMGGSLYLARPSLRLPSWVPWHSPATWRGDIIGSPLARTARVAIIRFGVHGGLGAGETVRVPLDLRGLARRHVGHPSAQVRAAGLTLTVQELDFTHLTYTYTIPGGSSAFPQSNRLTNGRHVPVPVVTVNGYCSGDTSRMACAEIEAFPPQQAGARLTLTVPAFQVNNRTLKGPWRYSFIIP